MDTEIIKEMAAQSLDGQLTFPEIVTTLIRHGFESYHIDYLRAEGRYYHQNGESFLKKIELEIPGVARKFAADGIQKAIRRSQNGQASYLDFIRDSAAAGCAYYIVYLHGKKVCYFGRDGDEHTEHFPASS